MEMQLCLGQRPDKGRRSQFTRKVH
jgi:hypothetical protein